MTKDRLPPGSLLVSVVAMGILLWGSWFFFVGKSPSKPDATWLRIQQEGVLRVGIDPSFPPFESDDGHGHLSGLDIDLAAAMAQHWGVHVDYVYTGYDGLYDALNAGQFDLILSAVPYNPSKTEDVDFSHSYFNGGPVLVVRSGIRLGGLADLADRPVAVELGTSGDAVARRWQGRLKLDVREFSTTLEALAAAQLGYVDAALVDPISFFDFVKRPTNTPPILEIAGRSLADELYVVVTRKNTKTLLEHVDEVIDALTREGTLLELQKKWF